jgi:hypothetical protein
MAFTYTAEQFQARNEFFSARSVDAIEAAIASARVGISQAVCTAQEGGDVAKGQALYDQIVELRTIENLLSGFTGLPTSVTKESGMLADVRLKLKQLYILATPRCGVAGMCP